MELYINNERVECKESTKKQMLFEMEQEKVIKSSVGLFKNGMWVYYIITK